MQIRKGSEANTIKRVNISAIEGVSNSLVSYLNQDCREAFRCVVVTYYGDTVEGVLYVADLRDFLTAKDFEEIDANLLGQLEALCVFAEKNQINEIIFS